MTGYWDGAVYRNIRGIAKDKPVFSFVKEQMQEKESTQNRKKKKSLIIAIPITFICICVIAFVLFGFFSEYFVIKNITVSGLLEDSYEQIITDSGIKSNSKIFTINTKKAEQNILRANTNIATVSVKKNFPADISITVTYETPQYFVKVTGEYYTLSESLRVLERTSSRRSCEEMGLVYIEVPNVKRCVTGERLEFFGDDGDYVKEFLSVLSESSFGSEIDRVYIKGKFDISLVKIDKYRIELGDYKDESLKLKMAEKVLDAGNYREASGVVLDVSDVSEVSVQVDKSLKIE